MAGDVAVDLNAEAKRRELLKYHLSFKIILRLIMAVQAPSQLFVFLYYVIPYLFEDYSDGTRNFLSFLVILGTCEGLANYMFVILYDTSIPRKIHQADKNGIRALHHVTNTTNENGVTVNLPVDRYDDDSGLKWRYCERCESEMPPRSWHCDVCDVCILKRDHHCFMVGNCIGLKNQRYFVVLAFYAVLCGLGGGYFQYKYLQTFYYPVCWSWTDFFPPITAYRWLFGQVETLTFHLLVMICQIYLEILFGTFGFLYFTFQMTVIAKGLTAFEMAKRVSVRNTNPKNYNFQTVFGEYWVLNFIFPMQAFFAPKADGILWVGVKMDHSS